MTFRLPIFVFSGPMLAAIIVAVPCSAQDKPAADAAAAAKAQADDDGPDESLFPLIHEWQKEGYNFWVELKAVLGQNAFPDAAQLIFETSPQVDRGLMPDLRDPDLLMPYGTMIESVLAEHREVREALRERYGKLAELRAIAARGTGDASAMQTLATQFHGTGIGADAHRWLGDRQLSAGRFLDAAAHYRQALEFASAEDRPTVAVGLRLAAAATGFAAGEPAQSDVRIGNTRMTAAEFERLVLRLHQRPHGWASAHAGGLASTEHGPAPLPGRYQIRLRSEEFEDGSRPAVRSRERKDRFDWAPGHFSATTFGELLVAYDGRFVSAIRLSSAEEVWFHDFGEKNASRAAAWKNVLLRPLVVPGRVYIRRGSEQGLDLCAMDLLTGEVSSATATGCSIITDPIVDADGLAVLAVMPELPLSQKKTSRPPWYGKRTRRPSTAPAWEVRWTAYDRTLGEPTLTRLLARLQARDRGVPICRATANEDSIVAGLPGGLICADRAGKLRWVRRHPAADAISPAVEYAAPILSNGRVLVLKPGGGWVQCLDLRIGKLLWECPLPDAVGLVGVAGGRLIAQSNSSLTAIQLADGQVAWRHETGVLCQAVLCGEPGGLVYSSAGEESEDGRRPMLIWVDMKTGQTAAEQPIDRPQVRGRPPRSLAIGMLLNNDGRFFVSFRPYDYYLRKLPGLMEFVPLLDETTNRAAAAGSAR